MPLDALASAPHYADHLAAVWGALPLGVRGSFVSAGTAVADRVLELGFQPTPRSAAANPVLVASFGDLRRAEHLGYQRIAIMEHGAGQSYGGRTSSGRHGSYAGGQGRGAASLFLHPGRHPARRDEQAYPTSRVEVVGSPHLDTLPARAPGPGPVVAFSFHFNAYVAPEAKTAFPWVWRAVVGLQGRYTGLLGHGHPIAFDRLRRFYRTQPGIEAVREFTEVCRRADVYVCDNSSTIFAFAATGRPVVLLNPPHYDRQVNHGLRFWEAAGVGVNCYDPSRLAQCIDQALQDTDAQRAARERALDLVYAYRTGAAARAAGVLQEWMS